MSNKTAPKSLVEAVQFVFDALEPFDEAARQRILASAMSLLGGNVPPITSTPTGSHGALRVPILPFAGATAQTYNVPKPGKMHCEHVFETVMMH